MTVHFEPDAGAEPIAVIGMATRVPGAADTAQFWENLVSGVESVTPLRRERMAAAGATEQELDDKNLVAAAFVLDDVDQFDAGLFDMTPREAEVTDPQHRVFLELCHAALIDAGHDPGRYQGDIGVYAGRGTERYRWEHVHRNRSVVATTPSMAIGVGNLSDNVTTLVSFKLNLRGPSVSAFTACSTSLVTVHMATEALRAAECDMAIAGGVSIEFPQDRGHVYNEGGVSSADGHVRSFDADATGTMWGSGGGAVLLKRLSDAERDGDHVYAVILGSAINNDGAGKVGFTAPSVEGQAMAITAALAVADVDPRTITYVEAHGTGTPLGDPIEIAALTSVYGQDTTDRGWCGIGSVKTNIGHLSQGAGVVGLIKTVLSMEHGLIPPSLHYERPNPRIDFATSPFYVNATLSKWERDGNPRRAAVSSFGIGGTNAHVILEEAPERAAPPLVDGPHLLRLSAHTDAALARSGERLADHLTDRPDARLADIAHTLAVGRPSLAHRGFVVADTTEAAATALRDARRRGDSVVTAGAPRVAFLFTGQGAQYGGMGATLYRRERVFAAAVDECAAVLSTELGVDIRELMFATGAAADAALADTAITQPALFTLEYALARLWRSWGLTPDTMIGHSVGEYVAATVAGVFDLADALRLVATRGRLMAAMPAGAMAALSMSVDAVTALLPDGLSVATVNGPGTCVVAGPTTLLEEFTSGLPKKVGAKRLRTSHAFHSPMMDPILPEFAAAVAAVPRHAPKLRFLSTVSGAPITDEQATDPGYWAAQLRETVRFGDCVAGLIADGAPLFVECGPGRQLAGLVRMQSRGNGPPAVPSLPGPTDKLDDVATLLTAAGTLWTAGVAVSPPTAGRRVPLPPYPYQRSRHWVDADEPAAHAVAAAPVDDRRQPADRWFAVPTWHQQAPVTMPELPASCLLFAAGELGAETARRLRAAGCAVTEVLAGPAYGRTPGGFTVRPDEAVDYAAVLADLGEPPEWVVHTWSLATEPSRDDVEATWDAQRLGLFSVVRLVQAAAGAGLVPRLDVVTTATQQVVGGDLTRPEHATIAGVVRSAPYDVPGLRMRQLDVDDTTSAADLAAALGRPGDDDLVALRGGRMWTLDYAQTRLPEPPADVIRDRGVYLITGGLGGLGLTIAEHLAEHRSARLVLTSRSGLPPTDEWDRPHDERTTHAIAAVRRMTAAGAEVVTAAVDVSDVDGLRRLREETLARFGGLHGIVHAAGVAGGGLIETRPVEDMRTVLAPKLAGTVALRAVFGADELDFVSLFSSVTGTAGGLAETDYCAANAYLDAHAQSAGWRAPMRSLGWTGWLEVGMLADLFRTTERIDGPPEPVGHPLVTELRRSENGTVVATGTISAATHWALADHLIDGVPVLPGTAQVEAMRAVADAALPGTGAVELSEVLFLEPLRVPDGQAAELRIVLRPQGTDSAEVTLSHGGTTYGRATAARSTARRDEPLDLAAVRAKCTIRPELVAMSHNPPGALVSYGARWRNIREVWRSEREQLTLLEVPDESRGDLADWAMSPAVLDQATFVFNGTGGGALPMGYGRIVVHDRLPARVWVHRILDPATGQDLRTDSFTLVDDAGTVLVSVTDFLLRRVADAPRPPAGPVSSATVPDDAAQRWLAPAEGVAAFLRATAANVGGHVVITPRPLAWVLEQNRIDAQKILGGTVDGPQETVHAGSWSSPTETVVAGIWSAVLGLPEVSAADDFFALGGNSLVAVQLITQIREATGVRLPLRSIFETPTVAAMAATVEELRGQSEPEPAPAMTIPRLARTSD